MPAHAIHLALPCDAATQSSTAVDVPAMAPAKTPYPTASSSPFLPPLHLPPLDLVWLPEYEFSWPNTVAKNAIAQKTVSHETVTHMTTASPKTPPPPQDTPVPTLDKMFPLQASSPPPTKAMSTPVVLPAELIDMILDALFTCTRHPWSTRANPCANGHQPTPLPSLLPLRLVSRAFSHRVTPILFHHMICRAPRHRYRMLHHFSRSYLSQYIRVLWLEVAPADLGPRVRRVTQSISTTPEKKLLHYLEVLGMVLPAVLKRFSQVRVLHLTTTYAGMLEKRLPKLEVLPHCFETLCECVTKAELSNLEELELGVPYEGGYTNFFEDLEDKKYERALRRIKGLRNASVKLFDHQGSFTTMPFF